MTQRDELHERPLRDLAALKLLRIAQTYRETLDEAARHNTSTLEVLSTLFAEEATARTDRTLQRRALVAAEMKTRTDEPGGR